MASVRNNERIAIQDIPTLAYADFYAAMSSLLAHEYNHCVLYYMYPIGNQLKAMACVANDQTQEIYVLSYEIPREQPPVLESLTAKFYQLHVYEREIWENWGVEFANHPWLKPVRFAFDRAIPMQLHDYPFYKIDSEEMHEVGVGPIHAGVIEPGHFRFLCHGETVYHLEIQLGWQHRGVERVFLDKSTQLQRHSLCESIAGDTAIGHNSTFAHNAEALMGVQVGKRLQVERSLALEMERVAMHIFDLSNLCTGVAYQLGNSVFGALRTPIINFMQAWCGNRFGKGLIRTAGSHYPLTDELRQRLWKMLEDFEQKFDEIAHHTFSLPSVQNRFDGIGKVTRKQMYLIGAVGVAARMAGLCRDVRMSHPNDAFVDFQYEPVLLEDGDVFARFLMRRLELKRSLVLIRAWLTNPDYWKEELPKPASALRPTFASDSFVVSLTEAWRGEIAHAAVTDAAGNIAHYKVKDPSLHNWTALALSLRNLEISDFPINNKSYDLSYCGHDL